MVVSITTKFGTGIAVTLSISFDVHSKHTINKENNQLCKLIKYTQVHKTFQLNFKMLAQN